MIFLYKEVSLFKKKINIITIIWFALALIAVSLEVLRNSTNNYLIFKQVFWHVLDRKDLYAKYPAEYFDVNHYGPLFSSVIAPFAILPTSIGCVLWGITNALILFLAIRLLNIPAQKQLIILAITVIEMMTAIHNVQFNPMIAAFIILAFILVDEEQDVWATLFIAAGFLTKIYGIAGLVFFVFSKHKLKFALSFIFWAVVLFALPMLYSSPQYIINTYHQWFYNLIEKNNENVAGNLSSPHQDISVMGMIRRITNNSSFPNLTILIPSAILIVSPLLRIKQYAYTNFRLSYLAIVLISVVIFSSSAESSTYIIAVCGVGIWYIINQKQNKTLTGILLAFVFALTILSPTDLYPNVVRDFIRNYSLKALPCFIVWLWLIANIWFCDFKNEKAVL